MSAARSTLAALYLFASGCAPLTADAATSGLDVSVDPNGRYEIRAQLLDWTFGCDIGQVRGPMAASTYSDHGGLRALYVFAYSRAAAGQHRWPRSRPRHSV